MKPYLGPEELVEEYRATIRELAEESGFYKVAVTNGTVRDVAASQARGDELSNRAQALRDALVEAGATVIESHAAILEAARRSRRDS